MEKHGNAEETQTASVFMSDAVQQVAKDEREKGSIATDHGNMTRLSMPTQVTEVPHVAANTNSMLLPQIYQSASSLNSPIKGDSCSGWDGCEYSLGVSFEGYSYQACWPNSRSAYFGIIISLLP
jgi:hypothetical protein